MIKYLRDKIIGRPAVFSHAGDLQIDDHLPCLNKTNSQNGLNETILINSNDATSQVEKLVASGNVISAGRRSLPSSSPIVIPKKPPRSNASSQSSSSYTSVVDPSSSLNESFLPLDDVPNPSLPTLPLTCQQLEHSAARDRISVKNKRRQPIKQKLSTLREIDDNDIDLFSLKNEAISSTPEEEQSILLATRTEPKKPQPLIDLSDLDTARARLRISVRSRDRSADNILLATNTNTESSSPAQSTVVPALSTPIQRSLSFKRVQENHDNKLTNRICLNSKKEDTHENVISTSKPIENKSSLIDLSVQNENIDEQRNFKSSSPADSRSRSSSQEHIYDNLDVFKRPKRNMQSSSNEDEVKTREHPLSTPRLRPVTMHASTSTDKQMTNEFENVFNQLKKRGSIRKVRPNEETVPEPTPPAPIEELHTAPCSFLQSNHEQLMPIETIPTPPTPNRRKTIVGVHLSANNKVATNDTNKPTPSWIDIAKQKQNKFQLVSNEKKHPDESDQRSPLQSPVIVRKPISSVDVRSNRKSMFEQSTTQMNAHAMERDSIRALKAGNPNRINNLIQFFDK
ncbi:unnamed protein product [Rotaria magnacalcarata]|nr:unnamed protein product [Rotaria magnacalcarata]CAF3760199.1 unnamed protein product [Rotaria magnacalcarata]